MEEWAGRVALVAGVGSTAGRRLTEALLAAGLTVVASAHTPFHLEGEAALEGGRRLYVREAHPEEEEEQLAALAHARQLGPLRLLVLASQPFAASPPAQGSCPRRRSCVLDSSVSVWRSSLDAGVVVRAALARAAVALAEESAHSEDTSLVILNVNSCGEEDAVGAASAAAARALCASLREEVDAKGRRVRVACLSVGAAPASEEAVEAADLHEALSLVLTAPPEAQVVEVSVRGDGRRW